MRHSAGNDAGAAPRSRLTTPRVLLFQVCCDGTYLAYEAAAERALSFPPTQFLSRTLTAAR